MRRAAHQLFDDPKVFVDPIAVPILGADATALLERDRAETRSETLSAALRAFMSVRSRFAEDALAEAVARGVTQYVVLGAGLDTFAYRNPFSKLQVFEVDHPATQGWKRHMLEQGGIAVPASLEFVAIDFEKITLVEGLLASRFNPSAPAFFSWLGVTMYLAEPTVMDVFRFVAQLPAGSGIAFDYSVSPSRLGFRERMVLAAFARRVAAIGEPWTTFFDPDALVTALRDAGFQRVEDFSPDDINRRYFSGRSDGLQVGTLARLMKAAK